MRKIISLNYSMEEKIIKKLNTYELLEVITINIQKAGKDYLTWIDHEIGSI